MGNEKCKMGNDGLFYVEVERERRLREEKIGNVEKKVPRMNCRIFRGRIG
jgi:hypothetical protein